MHPCKIFAGENTNKAREDYPPGYYYALILFRQVEGPATVMSEERPPIPRIQVPPMLRVDVHERDGPNILSLHKLAAEEHGAVRVLVGPWDVGDLIFVSVDLEVERAEATFAIVRRYHRERS